MSKKRIVNLVDFEWLQQQNDNPIEYVTLSSPTREQSLMISMKIQQAYEEEKPLLILYQGKFGLHQFCGFVDQIDPYERWIQLANGCLKKKIKFPMIVEIEII
jgi:Tfp pilus assembly protein PilO